MTKRISQEEVKKIFVVPHTHWDREWYLPFQHFRFQLVELVDDLLDILSKQEYYFMLDGQTIILEDYLEIRPERRKELVKFIQKGNLAVGPWYLLPDEWLVGQESLVRNLEISLDLAKEFEIPLMNIGYLPDQFGHSRAIPQILGDLTSISTAVIWRGVGHEITTVPFTWKSHPSAKKSISGIYMPLGYGNAAHLIDEIDALKEQVKECVNSLESFSPFPVYLLMNGTDHQTASPKLSHLLKELEDQETKISLCLLEDFSSELNSQMKNSNYNPPEYSGEFRSSSRAHLLQDTYSARMWIKQWNQKIEDLLVYYAEPLSVYSRLSFGVEYPVSYLNTAWKWLLKNHPHDSICGCSVDQTHEEMKARFYWAESIAEIVTKGALAEHKKKKEKSDNSHLLVYNPTNCSDTPVYFEFSVPIQTKIHSVKSENNLSYQIQPISSSEEIIFEETFNPIMLKAGFKMLPGRKLPGNNFINEVFITESSDPSVCEISIICDSDPIGDFSVDDLKKQGRELIDSKKYKKFHVKATKGTMQKYAALAPLNSFAISEFTLKKEPILDNASQMFEYSKNTVENEFYTLSFNKDGSFDLVDKKNVLEFKEMHKFEDWGDRGDEYTFGRVGPESAKASQIKRRLTIQGPVICEIEQTMNLHLFEQINEKRDKRTGKVSIPVTSIFRFYRDIPRIDIKTKLTNRTKDHRLRICFDLPFLADETITSTHFGFTRRKSDPIGDNSYEETPSGIQAQKNFIRVEDPVQDSAITLMNKGLPEVELANNSRLALTLIRSVGYLSRADFPERPMHAGPFLETPGAQEINADYSFEYSILVHKKTIPIHYSFDQAEISCLVSRSLSFLDNQAKVDLIKSIIDIDNPWIKISSLRIKENKIWLTLFNLDENSQKLNAKLEGKIKDCVQRKIDGTEVKRCAVKTNILEVNFDPFEIKIIEMD
ncbi:MAG: hypothetical protein H7645_07595 [Candidatus Heimdallarchaeota archaeon]|nr:hypothetical protein [Candidatus Heimdallarchaeota archaeon]MCK4770187.1 hypothetical protein [Candidatus Heimdallarchaeota archaeon]